MKTLKITYWATTALIAGMMCFSAFMYLTNPEIPAGFKHLGYPDHLRIMLAFAKVTGAILLLLPLAGRYKEWAYAGFTFNFIAATTAHAVAGDPPSSTMSPLIFLVVLAVSYVTYHKLQKKQCAFKPELRNQLSAAA